jgi:ABC-2 type transport system permease protein
MMSPVSYTLAPVVNGLTLPLLLLSGVMLPMTLAPDWLQTVAKLNPLFHAVSAIRALFNASYADGEILTGLVVLVVLAVATITLGARSFGRAAS